MTCGCSNSGSNDISTLICQGNVPCQTTGGSCNRCNCSPCQCQTVGVPAPTPYYNCAGDIVENHKQLIIQQTFATSIKNSADFIVPACGSTAIVAFTGLTVLQIGSYLWSAIYGSFQVTAFDVQSGEVTILNECFSQNAAPGSTIPACSLFNISQNPFDCCTCVSVYQYGAKGDGLTDDTISIQNAIDAVGSLGGGVVCIPQGTFPITNLVMDSPNVKLLGEGFGISILKKITSGNNTEAILITASNCFCVDFTILGTSPSYHILNEYGIWARRPNPVAGAKLENLFIEGVEVSNIGGTGILCDNINYPKIVNCKIHDNGYSGIGFRSCDFGAANFNTIYDIVPDLLATSYGIYFMQNGFGGDKTTTGWAEGNKISGVAGEAVSVQGCDSIIVADNNIYMCTKGVQILADTVNSFVSNYCIVTNNTITAASFGAPLDNGITYKGKDANTRATGGCISGNTLLYQGNIALTTGAIYFTFTEGLTVTGNTLNDSFTVAIFIDKTNVNFTVVGNTVNFIRNTTNIANCAGVYVKDTGNVGLISTNFINGTDPTPGPGAYCIALIVASPFVHFGRNRLSTTATQWLNAVNGGAGVELTGSNNLTPGNILAGATYTNTISVTGAALGDAAQVTASYDLGGLTLTAYVNVADTVNFVIYNSTANPVNLGAGTYKARTLRI